MRLGSQRWLRVVFLATAVVFVGVAVYLYAFRFFDWLESDAAVTALLAAKALDARSPIVGDWYYANGDVWGPAPHLLAVLPVAVLGLGPVSLLISVILGFVLEIVVFVRIYLRLCGELWIAIFATMATLMAWSNAHVAYEYIQLAYGFGTCLYMLCFSTFASFAGSARPRRWWAVAAGLLVALIAVQNPSRGFLYAVAPLLVACLWPWRAFAVRRRLALAAAAVVGWGLALAAYRWLISPAVAFSVPRGHVGFLLGGATRIKHNLALLGRGLAMLCGGGAELDVRGISGMLILAGAIALVSREVFASRACTALRFVCVVVFAQLGGVLVPLLVGNLLTDPESARYLMPSLLAMLGLAVVIAVRGLGEAGPWARRLAIGWLAAIPLTALGAVPDVRPPTPRRYVWPDAPELARVADELVQRGLTHGFAINLAANLLTLDSGGAALTCPIYFRNVIMAQRWLADTSCFAASALPERFFVVADQTEYVRSAIRATLPPEIERFSVGDTYEVYVYRTAETSLSWFELPIADGELATFPMRLPATHLQLVRGNVAVEAGELVATGEPGTVLYGPYLELPKGHYDVSWIGSGIDSGGQISFSASAGSKVLAQPFIVPAKDLPGDRTELVRLSFTVSRTLAAVELPIRSVDGGRVSLHELVIERRR